MPFAAPAPRRWCRCARRWRRGCRRADDVPHRAPAGETTHARGAPDGIVSRGRRGRTFGSAMPLARASAATVVPLRAAMAPRVSPGRDGHRGGRGAPRRRRPGRRRRTGDEGARGPGRRARESGVHAGASSAFPAVISSPPPPPPPPSFSGPSPPPPGPSPGPPRAPLAQPSGRMAAMEPRGDPDRGRGARRERRRRCTWPTSGTTASWWSTPTWPACARRRSSTPAACAPPGGAGQRGAVRGDDRLLRRAHREEFGFRERGYLWLHGPGRLGAGGRARGDAERVRPRGRAAVAPAEVARRWPVIDRRRRTWRARPSRRGTAW